MDIFVVNQIINFPHQQFQRCQKHQNAWYLADYDVHQNSIFVPFPFFFQWCLVNVNKIFRCTTNTWLVTFHSTSKEVKFYALKGLFFNLFPFHLIIFLLFKIWDVIITVIFIVIIAMIMTNSTPSTTIIRCCSIHFKV